MVIALGMEKSAGTIYLEEREIEEYDAYIAYYTTYPMIGAVARTGIRRRNLLYAVPYHTAQQSIRWRRDLVTPRQPITVNQTVHPRRDKIERVTDMMILAPRPRRRGGLFILASNVLRRAVTGSA